MERRTDRKANLPSVAVIACALAVGVAAPARAQPARPLPPPIPAAPPPVMGTDARAMVERLNVLLARPGGLTADEVARRAEATSLDVVSRRADIINAASQVDQAYAAFFPRLSLLAKYTRLNEITPGSFFPRGTALTGCLTNADGTMCASGAIPVQFSFPILNNQTILTASLTIPISDYVLRSVQGLAAAAASKRAADISFRATRLKTRADARALYYNWVRARLSEEVTAQSLLDSQGHLEDVKHLLQAGTASPADVMRVESQVAAAELVVERSRNLTRVLADQVATAMHERGAYRYEIGEDVHARLDNLPEVGDDPMPLVDESSRKRLELKALAENVTTIREQARTVRAGFYPNVSLFGDASYLNPNQRIVPNQDRFDPAYDFGIQATWSPNDVAISYAQARGLDAKASQLDAQRQQLVDGVRAEVLQAWSSMREARTELDTTSRQLAASEESYRVRRELWKVGRATAVELTDAETDLTSARLAAVNADIDLRLASVRLIHAVGRDIGDK